MDGIRTTCGPDFVVGIRLSPERFGMKLAEVKEICTRLVNEGKTDFIDLSLWDYKKEPEEEEYKGKTLLQHFLEIDYKEVKLTVAGKIYSAKDVKDLLAQGVDFVTIGRAAILHFDFPDQVIANPKFKAVKLPVSRDYLRSQGLGEAFVNYMAGWEGFVEV